MPARTITLPNIRKMFPPDPGYVVIDADLERADAQVVAWEAGDEKLKRLFRTGADIHTANARSIFKVAAEAAVSTFQRDQSKKGVHAVNYGVKARTLAASLFISVAQAQEFIDGWFGDHPEIKEWHERIEMDLMLRRCVYNAWRFRRYYFDRIDEHLLPQALGWIGQSTVAVAINKGMKLIRKQLPQVKLLLQVHDSLVMQAPASECPDIFPEIKRLLQVEIPYPDPLVIPIGIKYSPENWGAVKEWKPGNAKEKVQ